MWLLHLDMPVAIQKQQVDKALGSEIFQRRALLILKVGILDHLGEISLGRSLLLKFLVNIHTSALY
jgi:hypothetical protein